MVVTQSSSSGRCGGSRVERRIEASRAIGELHRLVLPLSSSTAPRPTMLPTKSFAAPSPGEAGAPPGRTSASFAGPSLRGAAAHTQQISSLCSGAPATALGGAPLISPCARSFSCGDRTRGKRRVSSEKVATAQRACKWG
jgi:hypothetical protein